MVYSYPCPLCGRAVVVTVDDAGATLDNFETHHWPSATASMLVPRLEGKAW